MLGVPHVGHVGEGSESPMQLGLGLIVAAQGLERTGQAPAQGALRLLAGRPGGDGPANTGVFSRV